MQQRNNYRVFFLSFSSLLKFAKLFPHFCLLFTFLSIWNFCFRYRIPQAHTYIMYHTQVTCLHASIHACLLFEVMIYINLSEYIPLSWCIHCTREYQTNMKEWMKKKTHIWIKHESLNKKFSDTFYKMCALYSVNAFGRLLWTSHSVKFFVLGLVFFSLYR